LKVFRVFRRLFSRQKPQYDIDLREWLRKGKHYDMNTEEAFAFGQACVEMLKENDELKRQLMTKHREFGNG
jgi:hypothetical protein